MFAAAWWGTNVIFHPPKMLPMEIWPDRYRLSYDRVEFETSDGILLKAWLIPAQSPTDKTILLCHGWGDNKGDLLQHTHFLARRFNLFMPDFRQHGESRGSLSTVGCLEARDIEAALEFLKNARPSWSASPGIFGLSMGAAIALWAAARHPRIKAVAIEAPFASFNEVVAQWMKNKTHLPYFPTAWLTLLVARLRLGEDPEPYSPIYQISKISPRPLLAVAGELDRLMPLSVVRKLFDRAKEPKELWIIPEATHGKCEEKAGAEYHNRLTDFFAKHL